MTVWMVRPQASYGYGLEVRRYEEQAFLHNTVMLRREGLPDLTGRHETEVLELFRSLMPTATLHTVKERAQEAWAFHALMNAGDLVALPLASQAAIAFGEVEGECQHEPGAYRRQIAEWQVIPRRTLPPDLLRALSGIRQVEKLTPPTLEVRFRALLRCEADVVELLDAAPIPGDIGLYLEDTLRQRIETVFVRQGFADFIAALLEAQGLNVTLPVTGGLDFIACSGPPGLERVAFGVAILDPWKQLGDSDLRRYQATLKAEKLKRGLLVAWSGYRGLRPMFYRPHNLTLWDSRKIIEVLGECYEALPVDIKQVLPLKRAWLPEEIRR